MVTRVPVSARADALATLRRRLAVAAVGAAPGGSGVLTQKASTPVSAVWSGPLSRWRACSRPGGKSGRVAIMPPFTSPAASSGLRFLTPASPAYHPRIVPSPSGEAAAMRAQYDRRSPEGLLQLIDWMTRVLIRRGDLIVSDADGVVAVPADRVDQVLELAVNREWQEDATRKEILSGRTLTDILDLHELVHLLGYAR
jgi:hypothetical protein